MSKNKISEWSATASNNTDIGGIDIAEGCAPSGINNAIRELMAQVKDQQTGTDADNFTVGGALVVTGNTTLSSTLTANSSVGTSGQLLTSRGASLSPEWTTLTAFVSGMIMMWSGSIATVPSGWYVCDGNNSTPDLRNKFVIGSGTGATYAVGATGGSADAVVVSHTHTATSSVSDPTHNHPTQGFTGNLSGSNNAPVYNGGYNQGTVANNAASTGISVSTSVASAGVSGTNANLPPYYALCYIMKA
jgi:microcystin-dependent protein